MGHLYSPLKSEIITWIAERNPEYLLENKEWMNMIRSLLKNSQINLLI